MTRSILLSALVIVALVGVPDGNAQPLPKHEFRGAWIATVVNLDWPVSRSLSTSQQQAALVRQIDELHQAGVNAIFFQIRSESDAMYESSIEPWSYWLTGESGKAPNPFYDPLTFAIQEAHRRGMELHAWFNPFRANRNVSGGYTFDPMHVTVQHPEWMLYLNNSIGIVNPGIPAARQYVIDVIVDVVTRYDIDGVHFDDYFYPYPPNQIGSQDAETFNTYGGAFTSIADWRRDNINIFVREVHEQISAVKLDMKYGISPFGIWRNGTPPGITGLDAYNVIYADAPTWMANGWIDYLVPQLYWAFGGSQDYGKLAPWWMSVNSGRHVYPGHGLYRSERSTFSGTLFSASEIPRQVRFNRTNGIPGSVFFRARNITDFQSKGFADSLKSDLYRYPALTPSFPWSEQLQPGVPYNVATTWVSDVEVEVSWDIPFPQEFEPEARRFAVYRVRSAGAPDPASAMQDPANLLTVTGEATVVDAPGVAPEPYHYFVAAVNVNSVESDPSDYVTVDGRAVPIENVDLPASLFALSQNFPNPFNDATEIRFNMVAAAPVRLAIVDLLGRELAVLLDDAWYATGAYAVEWDGTDA
ncbi:MAG: family 10 glycosylhydrolase, partial [Rhodothermales bacterium]|nr:family 10 glycosylhydrolase [Rhodothermales bacterium]